MEWRHFTTSSGLSSPSFDNPQGKMIKLFCVLVGVAGSAFSVLIDPSDSVDDLKDAIKAKKSNKIKCDANELQLYLAIKKDGGWLPSNDEAALNLKDGEIHEDIQEVIDGKELDETWTIQEVLEDKNAPEPQSRQIHVLVVVPAQDDLLSQQFSALAVLLVQVMLLHVLTKAPTTLTERNEEFKDSLCEFYGCYRRRKSWVRCMLLDVEFPKSLVVASHLFRHSNAYLAFEMMRMSNIEDVKNGLLLFKPLKHAFDHFQISFIRDDANVFRLRLFDPFIRNTRLIDLDDRNGDEVLNAEQRQELDSSVLLTRNPCDFDVQKTFGDVEGSALMFTGLERPFCRCLNLQARVARMIAFRIIEPPHDFKDFWSDVALDEEMELLHQGILDADKDY